MGYLIRNGRKDFYYVDYAARSGLFCRIFSGQTVRTKGLNADALNDYAAARDGSGQLHICLKNRRNQILHMRETGAGFQTEILLEDGGNQYQIAYLRMAAQKDIYLFYRAYDAEERSYHVVCQQMRGDSGESEPQVIARLPGETSAYDVEARNGQIYVLTAGQAERRYSILLHTFNVQRNQWLPVKCLVQTNTEPECLTFCIADRGAIHIGYAVNQYGQHQLQYVQRLESEEPSFIQADRGHSLASAGSRLEPAMFILDGRIWIHWKEPAGIRMAVSSDGGLHFSSPRLCSIPQGAQPVYFIHHETERLQGKRFYGVFNPQPQLAILREIDTCGVFLEQPKEELRLLLEGQGQDRPCYGHYQDYRLQFQAFEEEQQRLLQQYQELEEQNAQLREESEGWRERCLAVQAQHKMDIKKREMLRSQSEDIPGDDIQEIS